MSATAPTVAPTLSPALTNWLSSHEDFSVLPSGKIQFSLSGLDFPASLPILEAFINGKAYKKTIKQQQEPKTLDLSSFSPHIIPHHDNPLKVYCRLTKISLNRSAKEISNHVNGKFYKKLIQQKKEKQEKRREYEAQQKKKAAEMNSGTDEGIFDRIDMEEILEEQEIIEDEEDEEAEEGMKDDDDEEEEEEEDDVVEESSDSADEFYVKGGRYNRAPGQVEENPGKSANSSAKHSNVQQSEIPQQVKKSSSDKKRKSSGAPEEIREKSKKKSSETENPSAEKKTQKHHKKK